MGSLLSRLIGRVLGGAQAAPDADKIRVGILGALGPCVPALDAGAAVELRWVAMGRRVRCQVVLRGGDRPVVTLFRGEGEGRHAAAAVVYVMAASAVGHAEGTPWLGAAQRLLEGVTERLREEGLL